MNINIIKIKKPKETIKIEKLCEYVNDELKSTTYVIRRGEYRSDVYLNEKEFELLKKEILKI